MSSRIAHFDCQFGAAGDMLLGALLDAGIDRTVFLAELAKLNLNEHFSFEMEKVHRCGLGALKVHVYEREGSHGHGTEGFHHHGQEGSQLHAHGSEGAHGHGSEGAHGHGSEGSHGHGSEGSHGHGSEGSHHREPDGSHLHANGQEGARGQGTEGSHLHAHAQEGAHDHGSEGSHVHGQEGSHVHGQEGSHAHGTEGSHHHGHTRGLTEITDIIQCSNISDNAKSLAVSIFKRLALAEARVHAVPVEQIHFHEVGAIDAIVDVVGFAIAYDLAKVESSSCTALPLGNGTVKTAHGNFPVPAPAVVELIQDASVLTSGLSIPFECLTPTGAAILCEIVDRWGSAPQFDKIDATGYGAGAKDPKDWPNVVRVLLGQGASNSVSCISAPAFESETISVLEANVDDQSPQAISFALEKILASGALDVFTIPVLMKKGRSGHLITVLCKTEDETRFQEMILRETSSIGVRKRRESRLFASRRWQELILENCTVRIKLAFDKLGNLVNAQPEFEDIALFSQRRGISIKEAQNRVMAAYYGSMSGEAAKIKESEDSK